MGNLRIDETEIRKTISVMKTPGQIFEVRIILDEKTNLLFDKWERICPKKKLPIRVGVFIFESKGICK